MNEICCIEAFAKRTFPVLASKISLVYQPVVDFSQCWKHKILNIQKKLHSLSNLQLLQFLYNFYHFFVKYNFQSPFVSNLLMLKNPPYLCFLGLENSPLNRFRIFLRNKKASKGKQNNSKIYWKYMAFLANEKSIKIMLINFFH